MTNIKSKLFGYTASYRTPYGRKVYVFGIKRGRSLPFEEDATRSIKIEICANPKRKVAGGVSGVKVEELQHIKD
jgi:hypothetical protein